MIEKTHLLSLRLSSQKLPDGLMYFHCNRIKMAHAHENWVIKDL